MQPHPQTQHGPDDDRHESGHRGPLSRTWPQLFKKRRRYSPVRESAQQQQQQQQYAPPQVQAQVPFVQQQQPPPYPYPQPPPVEVQPQHQGQDQPHVQLPIHPLRPLKPPPTITAQPVTSPSTSSIRSPPSTADTASTISTISHASSAPSKKVPITRRKSSLAPADSNGAGGVTTPQADLLASKSNYELISSGQHLEMGLHFSTAMATGVMMKRATHRAAEQARRDRMKNAMVDLAEFLLDGEVTFGSGTTCFVVMRGVGKEGEGRGEKEERKTVNKARLIEMALEKMRAQEREIEVLRKEVEGLKGLGEKMDES
ncbi:hypothetical protein NX059_001539 [Plenodomus lindquistii]|nr:hypothetical protein NX059_001539 [Plenodomus lindquistii]